MELIRGRWSKKYINCWEDKRDFDFMQRGFLRAHEETARDYCKRFSPPELTDIEKQQIAAYWAQYGIKIYDDSWHRMYYHATGNHDPRFVPDNIAGLVLYAYYNDHAYEDTWRDKNMFHRLLPDVPLPKAYGRRIRGRYVCEKSGYVNDYEDFAQAMCASLVAAGDKIVVKKTRETGFGRSVSKYDISNEEDVHTMLAQWSACTDYVVQECVKQHPVLESFNEKSSNMIRICSWRHGNEVDILYAAARVGTEDSFTDISFKNGEKHVNVVGISLDGIFSEKMVDQYGRMVRCIHQGMKVPAWNSILDIIKKNHLLIDNFDIIGWDFTIDEEEKPICFEWNVQWPGTVFYQFANGSPLYGDKTDAVLSFLIDQKNQDNYIPNYMKIK